MEGILYIASQCISRQQAKFPYIYSEELSESKTPGGSDVIALADRSLSREHTRTLSLLHCIKH